MPQALWVVDWWMFLSRESQRALVKLQEGILAVSVEDIHGSISSAVFNTLLDWSGGNKRVLFESPGGLQLTYSFYLDLLVSPLQGICNWASLQWLRKLSCLKQVVQVHSELQLVVWCIRCWQMGGRAWDAVGNQWFIAEPGTLNGCKCWVWGDSDVRTTGQKRREK